MIGEGDHLSRVLAASCKQQTAMTKEYKYVQVAFAKPIGMVPETLHLGEASIAPSLCNLAALSLVEFNEHSRSFSYIEHFQKVPDHHGADSEEDPSSNLGASLQRGSDGGEEGPPGLQAQ